MPNGDPAQATPFFTYREPPAKDLEQGDLLAKTAEIQDILRAIHPYYLREDYTHFLVLTQSCDLVRRSGKPPKSRYITIAAVRPFPLIIVREIEKYQEPFEKAAIVCSNQFRLLLIQFLDRLFNYNEHEFFYLHPEPLLGLTDPHCASLRLKVSIKASLHYETCIQARMLSLAPLYQAKLGWMIGNIYSRVGTEEWVPTAETKKDFDQRVRLLLDKACKWEDPKRLLKAKATVTAQLLDAGTEAIQKHIADTIVPDPVEEVITAVIAQLQKLAKVADDEEAKKIANRLRNDPVIAKLRKQQTQELE